jgi:formate dehydrogenase subunit gamma
MTDNAGSLPATRPGRYLTRFSLSQRVEHLLMIVSFTALMFTGIPQKFSEAPWALWSFNQFGGIDFFRSAHHFFAVLFILQGVYHLGYLAYSLVLKRQRASMMLGLSDAREAIHSILFLLGRMKTRPQHDRYDFRQKFEYWGVVWGSAVMIITGAIIWFPVLASRFMPGEFIPAAKAAHGGEAILALLVIVTWHFYHAHLNEHVWPFDMSIFTGKISEHRMIEEHPREYERLLSEQQTAMSEAED